MGAEAWQCPCLWWLRLGHRTRRCFSFLSDMRGAKGNDEGPNLLWLKIESSIKIYWIFELCKGGRNMNILTKRLGYSSLWKKDM